MEKPKNPFDDQKGMLDSGPDLRFRPVFRTINVAQRFIPRATFIGHIASFGSRLPDRSFLTLVGAIAPDLCFAAVKKLRDELAVMHIGWRNIDGMDNLLFAIHANVSLHAKIPLIAFFGLMHLGIAFLVVILCRGRRRNDRGVHNRSIADLDPLRLEMFVHRRKNLFAYSFFFYEMTEFADRRLVRRCFCAEVDPDKFAHRIAVVKAIFRLRVRQIEPLLKEVDPQH